MTIREENARVERLVDEAFALFEPQFRSYDSPVSWEAGWENGLTDFEWIDFWASLYSSELMSMEPPTVKH